MDAPVAEGKETVEAKPEEQSKKRNLEGEDVEKSAAKKTSSATVNKGAPNEISEELNEQLTEVDERIKKKEAACREEQIVVQCKYEQLKKPDIEDRHKLIEKIPNFWRTVIFSYFGGGNAKSSWIAKAEMPIFDHLEKVDIEYLNDNFGSHKFLFHFSENQWFDVKCFEKTVKIESENKPLIITNMPSPFEWKVNPFSADNSEEFEMSFFCWLLNKTDDERQENFGSLFKDNVWEDAITIFQSPARVEDTEEDSEGMYSVHDEDEEEYDEEYGEENMFDAEEEGEGGIFEEVDDEEEAVDDDAEVAASDEPEAAQGTEDKPESVEPAEEKKEA